MPDKHKHILHTFGIVAVLLILSWLFFKHIAGYAAPFVLAFIISRLIERPIKECEKLLHIPRKASALICILLFYALAFFILKTLVSGAITQLHQALDHFSDISLLSENITSYFNSFLGRLPEKYSGHIKNYTKDFLINFISGSISIPKALYNSIIAMSSAVPDAFIFTFTTVVSSYFLSADAPRIYSFIYRKLPLTIAKHIKRIKEIIKSTTLRYIYALIILSGITFLELLLGFFLLKIPKATTTAFIIACVDALPVLGCGFILLPWAIFSLIRGAHKLSIGLSLLYLISAITHNVLEAKIIGVQTGLHPLITIASIYIGLRLFGAYGLLAPLLVSFIFKILRLYNNTAAV